jgi:hypothetical protein
VPLRSRVHRPLDPDSHHKHASDRDEQGDQPSERLTRLDGLADHNQDKNENKTKEACRNEVRPTGRTPIPPSLIATVSHRLSMARQRAPIGTSARREAARYQALRPRSRRPAASTRRDGFHRPRTYRRECRMSPGYEAGSDDAMPISARNSSATVGASVGRYETTTASPDRTWPGVRTRR